MTAESQPNNATPKRLKLAPHVVPRMPFSSPMGEEVLSPTSPNASRSPPQHQIILSQSRQEKENVPGNKWQLPSQRPVTGGRKQSQEEMENRLRWPGLNVVTNFSKAPSLVHRATEGGGRQYDGLGLKKQQGGSVATSRKASIETLGLGHQQSHKSLKTLGSKGRLGDLKRASSKWSNLSPSDRAVVIGISVSPEELAHHSSSPQASPQNSKGLSEQHATDRRSAVMPSIVITPAKEKAPWSSEDEEEDPPHLIQSRIPSSVYSQALTHTSLQNIDSAIVPPIPPLPPEMQRQSFVDRIKGPTKKTPPRVVSSFTNIDESESKETLDETAEGPGRSQLRVLTKRASMDTIATRHRSQGWWNHIISPFFPKSPMGFKTPQQPMPDLPRVAKEETGLQQGRQTFPPPPKSEGLTSSRTSWTDSTLDADYEKRLELDGFHDRSTMIMDEPQQNLTRESALLPDKFEGFGAAAEYYEACLYDMHSDTPYFECQNHVCLPPKDARSMDPEIPVPRTCEEHEGPKEITSTEQQFGQPLAAQQAPMNRFSAAFLEAIKPKSKQRPMSDATVIDDLETTPDVQEAHAAPVMKAPIPIPAAQPTAPRSVRESEGGSPKSTKEPLTTIAPASSNSTRLDSARLPPESATGADPEGIRSATPIGSSCNRSPHSNNSPHYPFSKNGPIATSANPPPKHQHPKRYIAVMPPENHPQPIYEQPLSPEPLSPGQQRNVPKGIIPLEDMHKNNAPPYRDTLGGPSDRGTPKLKHDALHKTSGDPRHVSQFRVSKEILRPEEFPRNEYVPYRRPPSPGVRRDSQGHTKPKPTIADLYPPPRDPHAFQGSWQYEEKDTLPPRQQKKQRSIGFPKCKSCFNSAKPRNRKEKKMVIAIAVGLLLLVVLILALVMTITLRKKGHKTPVQAQWLNLTNLPPIPIGISTIIQPNAMDEVSDCMHPGTMWSCAVPKEEQDSLLPNAPNQPNFRVEIVFQNGTNATTDSNATSPSSFHKRSRAYIAKYNSASGYIKERLLRSRDNLSGSQYTPLPPAPNLEEQDFLGNTTDKNAEPFLGEFTPFYMSFEAAKKLSPQLLKRKGSASDDDTNPFPNSTDGIPPPNADPDGTAAPANLYPYPSYQPLRLYDRGLDTEHYGFYTYFDRSIFLKSASPLDDPANNDTAPIADDENGGTTEIAASVRCTWAQTRFLVQIWTKKGNSAIFLQSTNSTSSSSHSDSNSDNKTISSSSANNFTQPGSFPYPITITLDRHGGDIAKKSVYCYGLDNREHYNASSRQFQLEDRGIGGQAVNPAMGPFGNVNVTRKEGGPGGIDGGNGGCRCRWQNFGVGA